MTSGDIYVSVLIPVRNERLWVDSIVDNIISQKYNQVGKVEYIIIDGMSTDGSYEELAVRLLNGPTGSNLRVRMLRNENHYVSYGMNIGINEARGKIIIRWDGHTRYADDYIISCLHVLETTGAWNVGGAPMAIPVSYLQRAIASTYHSVFSVGGARSHNVKYEGPVDSVCFGCWYRQTLLDLGGFDEELVRNQDDELNLRIVRAGGKVYQSPEVRSWYSPRTRLRDLFKQYMQYGYWKVRVIKKHRIPASTRHVVPLLFVVGLLFGPITAVISKSLAAVYYTAVLLYVFLLLAFSVSASRKDGWDLLPVIPIVFLTYHVAYGVGFLAGVLLNSDSGRATVSKVFTGLSR